MMVSKAIKIAIPIICIIIAIILIVVIVVVATDVDNVENIGMYIRVIHHFFKQFLAKSK